MKELLLSTLLPLFFCLGAYSQSREISAKVTDSIGNGLSGASINVKGAKKGTSAGPDGNFKLTAPAGATLLISAIGYTPREIGVAAADRATIQLLASRSGELTEVVITSLGTKREKSALTYSTQEIKGDALSASKQDNVINDIAGKVSGVQVTNSTGMPGSSARIVIRGATSLTGDNQPLFVIDGVPVDNTEAGSIDAFGQGADNVSLNQGSTSDRAIDIDPNIIESMTVLKGAAATALYGSAGARGAIIITTKSGGKSSRPVISLGSSYSMADPIYYPFQDKYAQGLNGQYIDGNNGQKSSGSWGPLIDTLKVNGLPVKKHNPQKEFFRTGHTTDNNISVSGGADKSKYLLSYSYLKTDGIIPKTDFTRHAVFAKFSNQLSNTFTINYQLNYINSLNHRVAEGNGLAAPLWTVFAAPISWDPFPTTYPDGTQRLYRSLSRNNPYFVLNNTGFVSAVNRFLPVASFVYSPLPWITITERIGADIYSDQTSYHESSKINNGYFQNSGGVSSREQNFRQFNNDLFVEMHKNIGRDLYASLLIGTNLFSQYNETYTQTGLGTNVDNFYNISGTTTITALDQLARYRKVGYYAQANFSYRKFLDLSLTGRYDGSSVLALDKNYYPYGSAGLGFIFSEFLRGDHSAISFGKIRVSYSSVGNDNLPPYSLSTPFVQSTGTANNISYPFNGHNAFSILNNLGNPTLKNESLNEFETGLELKMFHNRISFEGSYFDRKTKDLLTPVPIGQSSGFFISELNAGSMQDKGIELLLNASIIRSKNLNWDVAVNFTRIRNKVLELAPNVSSIQFGGFGNGGVFAFAGLPYGIIYGSTYTRDKAGQLQVDDDGLPILGPNGNIGSVSPDFTAGLSNTINFKQFSLSFVLDWKKGGDVLNLDDTYNWFYGTPKTTEDRTPRVVHGVYASTGKPNTTPVSAQDYFTTISNISEASVEVATYFKVRSVGLSYTFSPAYLKNTPFRSAAITLNGSNLLIYAPHFTGSDPEANLQGSGNGQGIVNYLTPTSRSYIIGLKLVF